MEIGKTLWQSARNIQDSSLNLDLLWEALAPPSVDPAGRIIEHQSSDDDCDWVSPFRNRYYNVRENSKKRKANGSVTLAIQLTSNEVGNSWAFGKVAKVLAAYSPHGDDHWEFDAANPDTAGNCEDGPSWVCEEFRWVDPDGGGWFFAVPLDALNSTNAVEDYVIQPLLHLIAGRPPAEVFWGIEDKVCRPPQSGSL